MRCRCKCAVCHPFKGLVNGKLLAACKHGQLWVGISRSALFDEGALAAALCDGSIEACILDGMLRTACMKPSERRAAAWGNCPAYPMSL